jgi:hypothetical protein
MFLLLFICTALIAPNAVPRKPNSRSIWHLEILDAEAGKALFSEYISF